MIVEQYSKLVAAQAGQAVAFAELLLDQVRQCLNEVIAGGLASGVIDYSETIDVGV